MISIIIPVYNAEKYIQETIDSIIAQTYHEYELILVDDGSVDNSLAILKDNQNKYDFISVYTGENHGAPHARNIGIEAARGKHIIFFDADDIMDENCLGDLVSVKEEFGANLSIGMRRKIDEAGKIISNEIKEVKIKKYYLGRGDELSFLLNVDPFPGNKLYDAEIIKKYGIKFADVKIGQDLNFYLKFLVVAQTVVIVDKMVCSYRVVRGSISHNVSTKVLDIANSFDEAECFAERFNCDSTYLHQLNYLRIIHFRTQFQKYAFAKNVKERKEIFNKLYVLMKKVADVEHEELSQQAWQSLQYAEKRYKYKLLYLSSIYCMIRKIKWNGLPGVK